eukprot:COSAG02_NODE_5675_length_4138_cov_3.914088_4_plen_81_part_00
MDNPALARDSVIFESFSFISLDSIVDSIDSSQIPVLIGRSQRWRPKGPEEGLLLAVIRRGEFGLGLYSDLTDSIAELHAS